MRIKLLRHHLLLYTLLLVLIQMEFANLPSLVNVPLLQNPFLTSLSQAFAGNVYVSGIIMLLLNVGTSFLMQDIMPIAQKIFSNIWIRRLVFFAIFFTATRDLSASILLTLVFILIVDVFLNEQSAYYLLPNEYRTTNSEPFTNRGTTRVISERERFENFQQQAVQWERLRKLGDN